VRNHVQGVIKAMSLSISGCALALVNQQQLVKKTEWIYNWMGHTTIDEIFDQILNDHPDLCNAVKAQVSISYQLLKWFTRLFSLVGFQ